MDIFGRPLFCLFMPRKGYLGRASAVPTTAMEGNLSWRSQDWPLLIPFHPGPDANHVSVIFPLKALWCHRVRDHLCLKWAERYLSIWCTEWIKPWPLFCSWLFLWHSPFLSQVKGYPGASDYKESACSAEDPSSIPGSGRSPGEGTSNPLQYSYLENPMDRRAWRATVHGVAKSWTQLNN